MKLKLDVEKKMTHEVFGLSQEEYDLVITIVQKEYIDKMCREPLKRIEVLKKVLEQLPEKSIFYTLFFVGYTFGSFERGYESWEQKQRSEK